MNSILTNWWRHDGHPSEGELLVFIDGELPARTNGTLRNHLDACWSCRVRAEKIEETISTFIDYRNYVLKTLVEPPAHGWRRFDSKLNGLALEIGKPSLLSGVLGTLSRLLSTQYLSIIRERGGWERGRLVRILSLESPIVLRAITAVVIVAVLIAGLLYVNRPPVVTASELLRRASDAQERQIQVTTQAVIYQKLQVRRKNQVNEEMVSWEAWTDVTNGRVREAIADDTETRRHGDTENTTLSPRPRVPASPRPRSEALSRLTEVLRANHMNPTLPLAGASFEAWRQSLGHRNDEISKSTLADGHEALKLKTTATGQTNVGGIVEASLVVRVSDWHPVAEHLRVKGDQSDEEFELTETAYSVVSLTTLDPKIFADPPNTSATSSTSTLNTLHPTPESVSPLPASPLTPSASADLEVEVLRLLHEARADLGEQVSARRGVDGLLHVSGIVETAQRKAEIMRALQIVTDNPAIRIEIQTVAEAVAQQQQRSRSKSNPASVAEQQVEINSETIAAAPELRRYFQSDDQVREFAARMVSRSRNAMRHVYAMKRLMGQLSIDELRALTPEAKNKWLTLIRSHASAYQNEAAAIRGELRPIFFPNASGAAADVGAAITDDASLIRAVEQLFTVASANDGVIRSAFATSSGAGMTSAIGSAQFWQSMKNAEALAAAISRQ